MSALTNLKAKIITLGQKMLAYNYKIDNGQDTYATDLSQAVEDYCDEKITEEGLVPPIEETDPVFEAWIAATPPAYPGDELSTFSEDPNHRVVTDVEKADWNSKSDGTHNHNLNDLTEKSYSSLTDVPDLSSLHSHSNIADLDNVSGNNTGDETTLSILTKIGNGALIDSTYLPSYVDDIIEGYLLTGVFYEDGAHTIPITGETGKIYVDIPTNFLYRYSGSAYINISNPLDYSTDIEADKLSTTKVSAIKTFYDWAVGKFIDLSKLVTTWTATTLDANVPSEKLVKDSLNLKADITPANGSTSALRALFTSVPNANCVYNTATKYYEMNGITNLTEAQLLAAYPIVFNTVDLRGLMRYIYIRTNFPIQGLSYSDTRLNLSSFCLGSTIEVFSFRTHSALGNKVYVSSLKDSFRFCSSLKKIIGVLDVSAVTDFSSSFAFLGAFEQIELLGLKANIAFAQSPLITLYTLQYMVTNRANETNRITITVNATTWSRLNDVVNYPTWNALLVDAVNNQYIDFASA